MNLIMNNENIVQKLWSLCNILRGDGISYHEYISELTYLLFLKIAEETGTEDLLPVRHRWKDLVSFKGDNLLFHYQEMLTHLGGTGATETVREIYAFPTTVFNHSENLKAVIDGINKIDWHSVSDDGFGQIYEGLLAKNSEDARSGAGQYFTPRALVDCIVQVMKPQLGELIQDPASGSCGFLISADHFIRADNSKAQYHSNPPVYQGMEIEKGTHRISLMNTFLHRMNANIMLGDALTEDCRELQPADLILANPPFGAKAGSARQGRDDIQFMSTNKQFLFLQHIYLGLKPEGRAAVVLPDNVLYESAVGKEIRQDLMNRCNLHTILRLPTGIFYAPGVNTNVLFFTRGEKDKENTKKVWVYDMRANMHSFGKRTPLAIKHFEDFIKCFGNDPHGKAKRKDLGEEGRFRCFTREWIKDDKDDSLDISWFGTVSELPEPTVLAQEAMGELEAAMAELRGIMAELGVEVEG
jgi:type I restriction enzyme M protein